MVRPSARTSRARTDERDWLVEADEALAGLQLRSGGDIPGIIASPALLELVRTARLFGLKLARSIRAQDNGEQVTAWIEVAPDANGQGCSVHASNWQSSPLRQEDGSEAERRGVALARQMAELSARLGSAQEVLAVDANAPDLEPLLEQMRQGLGSPWTDFVEFETGAQHQQPLHWRLLDGARMTAPGSPRTWCAHLVPLGAPIPGSSGFELHLVAEEPLEPRGGGATAPTHRTFSTAVGREIAPVLRQPIARIIANAETIRTQLAGPLAEEYSNYAADIATAGEHLLALLDDLIALEVVEDEQFTTAPDQINLADLARRAAGILGVRARERGIAIHVPAMEENAPAIGEFRRVLQVLLNLLGNAIRYSPEGSHIRLHVEPDHERARVIVADQGPGLTQEQQAQLFEKFERLGRTGDGGSGLGLYISRRLARAMGGDLTVESAPGQGARFTLELPLDQNS